jgi:DNA invertase Pin-like site-specific DNA recombinase
MIYGYIRTSTDKQNNENQHYEIEQFAKNNNIIIDKWIEETISSKKDLEERKLGKLLKKIKQGDIIIASELSRLGRNLLQVMSILHHCMNIGCQVWTIKDNYRLGTDIQSKVLAFAFGLSAEIERNLISQRTKEALARIKADGKHLGRPHGFKTMKRKLDGKNKQLVGLLEKNVPKTQIAKMLGIERSLIYTFLKVHNLREYINKKQ